MPFTEIEKAFWNTLYILNDIRIFLNSLYSLLKQVQ